MWVNTNPLTMQWNVDEWGRLVQWHCAASCWCHGGVNLSDFKTCKWAGGGCCRPLPRQPSLAQTGRDTLSTPPHNVTRYILCQHHHTMSQDTYSVYTTTQCHKIHTLSTPSHNVTRYILCLHHHTMSQDTYSVNTTTQCHKIHTLSTPPHNVTRYILCLHHHIMSQDNRQTNIKNTI